MSIMNLNLNAEIYKSEKAAEFLCHSAAARV
jgi:hypothetical protein